MKLVWLTYVCVVVGLQGFLPIHLYRKWSHSAVAVSAGASNRPQLPVMYKLDRRWVGVQAD